MADYITRRYNQEMRVELRQQKRLKSLLNRIDEVLRLEYEDMDFNQSKVLEQARELVKSLVKV